jgi:hypothetical protein
MLKVITALGHGLVCLHTRRGTVFNLVAHKGSDDTSHLVCPDISRPRLRSAKEHRGGHLLRLPLNESRTFKWKRVQVVFNFMDAEFV